MAWAPRSAGACGVPLPRQIVRRGDDDATHRADAGRDRRAFRQRADAHRGVESLLDQVDRPIEQRERHRHVGETRQELGHDRHHVQAAEQDRRRDAQLAARRGPLARRRPLDLVEIGEHAPRARQEPLAGLGDARPRAWCG